MQRSGEIHLRAAGAALTPPALSGESAADSALLLISATRLCCVASRLFVVGLNFDL